MKKSSKRKNKGFWIPLRLKITSPYLFLAVVIAVISGYLFSQLVFDTVEERYVNQLIEGGKLASESVVQEEENLLEIFRLLAHAEGVAEAITNKDAETLRELTFGIVLDHRGEAVEFLDSEGNLLLTMMHKEGGLVEEYNFSSGGNCNCLEWDFVRKVLNQDIDGAGDKFAGLSQDRVEEYFFIAGPVTDSNGNHVGAILVGLSLENFVGKIREETLTQVSFYSLDGAVIASTLSEPQSIIDQTTAEVLSIQDSSTIRRSLDAIISIEYDEILGPFEVRQNEDIGILGVALPKTFLVNASNVTKFQVTVFIISSLIVVTFVGIILASYITNPIRKLLRASSRVAKGDLTVRVKNKSNDEISELSAVFNQMVANLSDSRLKLLIAYDETLEGWSKALEMKDKETQGHTRRVVAMTELLAKEFGFTGDKLIHIRRGALLHDIGKMGISDLVLLKSGDLSADDIATLKMHPEFAYQMLKDIEFLRPALEIPYCHHEWWDGTGYPRGLKGEEIPLAARIFAVVDTWDAIRSDRPYRAALSFEEAINEIINENGTHFDPKIVEKFIEILPAIEEKFLG